MKIKLKKLIGNPKIIKVNNNISEEQSMLQQLFGGGDRVMFNVPDSECKPQINGALMDSVINGDNPNEDNTSDLFGFGTQRKTTRRFFGIGE